MAGKSLVSALCFASVIFTTGSHAYPKSGSGKSSFSWKDTKYLLAFGDSYTYVQGTHGRQNYSFIGDYLDFSYSPKDLLSDKIVQNQTSTAEGGPNWVEHLTGCGLKAGLTSPLSCDKQLWDFAFAGADISLEYTPLHHNFTVPLVNQTQQFLTYAQPTFYNHSLVTPASTLVAIWIGINDVGDSKKYGVDFPSFYNALIDTLFTSAVESIYDVGYRNFLFMNLPPIDRTPANAVLAADKRSPNATMVGWWNSILANHSTTFQASHAGAKTLLFDANTFLNGVLDAPAEYGFKNVTGYCASYDQPYINTDPESYGCLPLSEYFWFNTGHMTSHVHELLAGAVKKFLFAQ